MLDPLTIPDLPEMVANLMNGLCEHNGGFVTEKEILDQFQLTPSDKKDAVLKAIFTAIEQGKYYEDSLKTYKPTESIAVDPDTLEFLNINTSMRERIENSEEYLQILQVVLNMESEETQTLPKGFRKDLRQAVSTFCLRELQLRTISARKNEEIFVYFAARGIWLPEAEPMIKAITTYFYEDASRKDREEIIELIKSKTYVERDLFNTQPIIALQNVSFHLTKLTILPHSPLHYLTRTLPITYIPSENPKVDLCPKIAKFFHQIYPQQPDLLEEIAGYLLCPNYPLQIIIMLVGTGSNGKSTYLTLLEKFIGEDNVAAFTLQQLSSQNDYAKASLWGKLANISADLPNSSLKYTGLIKMLCGGDLVQGREIYKAPMKYRNSAKLLFSAQEIPLPESDDSDAFFRRFCILCFNQKFTEMDDSDKKDFVATLTSPQELSGLFLLAVQGLKRVLARGRFTQEKMSFEKTRKLYLSKSESAKFFCMNYCREESGKWILRAELYKNYVLVCQKHNLEAKNSSKFGELLLKYLPLTVANQKKLPAESGKKKLFNIYTNIEFLGLDHKIEDMSDDSTAPILDEKTDSNNTNHNVSRGTSPQETDITEDEDIPDIPDTLGKSLSREDSENSTPIESTVNNGFPSVSPMSTYVRDDLENPLNYYFDSTLDMSPLVKHLQDTIKAHFLGDNIFSLKDLGEYYDLKNNEDRMRQALEKLVKIGFLLCPADNKYTVI